MSDESKPPADFAMLRAAEILAQIHDRARKQVNVPPAALDRPVVLRCERIIFETGKTSRAQVERELGVAFSYPARGWHTYATKELGKRCLLSAFYRDALLVAVELYAPRSKNPPPLEPVDLGGFTLEPGGIAIGTAAGAVADVFSPAVGGPGNVVYDAAFEARFPGGVAYAMAKAGTVERLALYAHIPKNAA